MRFPFVLVPRDVYDGMVNDKRLLQRAMRTIIKMKVHGSFIPRERVVVASRPEDDARERLLEIIDSNPHAKSRPPIRKALVTYMDKQLRAHGNRLTPEKFDEVAEMLKNWSRRPVDTSDADDNEGDALDDEIELTFDDDNPRDASLKANLTRGG